MFGCGADEILELVVKAFLGPGDEAVFAWPSFAMYPIVVKGMGATPVTVPLDAALVHDLPALRAAITERTRVVFVCNPNNPTGTSVGAAAFDAFVRSLPAELVLVVDEAYREFARRPDFPDAIAWVGTPPRHDRDAHVLEDLRPRGAARGLRRVRRGARRLSEPRAPSVQRESARSGGSTRGARRRGARGALAARERGGRASTSRASSARSASRCGPRDANFVLVRAGEGIFDRLQREGVIVRPLAGFGMPDCVRVTIGLPEENERLVKTLARILGRTS